MNPSNLTSGCFLHFTQVLATGHLYRTPIPLTLCLMLGTTLSLLPEVAPMANSQAQAGKAPGAHPEPHRCWHLVGPAGRHSHPGPGAGRPCAGTAPGKAASRSGPAPCWMGGRGGMQEVKEPSCSAGRPPHTAHAPNTDRTFLSMYSTSEGRWELARSPSVRSASSTAGGGSFRCSVGVSFWIRKILVG
jgi:hypothetical protein